MNKADDNKRIIPFQHIYNFRDLGGYRVKDGRKIKYGCFFRGPAIALQQDSKDFERLESLHLKTILDLRSKNEAEEEPDVILPDCSYQQISAMYFPDGSECDFSPKGIDRIFQEEERRKQTGIEERFFITLYQDMPFHNPAYQQLFKAIQWQQTPLLFHCSAGKDRTGVAAMLILLLLGVDDETIMEDYLLTNICRKPLIDQRIAKEKAEGEEREHIINAMGVQPDTAWAVLHSIRERYPSQEAYFEKEFGMDAQEMTRLRNLYLE